jgi:putative ABC transport system substrate-binding protein
MRRRAFITLLGGAASSSLALPLAAWAQQGQLMRRIGVLMGTAENDPDQKASLSALVEALAALDWRDGRNIRIEYRWAAGDANLLRTQAAELASLSLDVVLAQGTPATAALLQSAPATPIVFVAVTDPVGSGLVANLAHPGSNITGFANYETTMAGKWLATLREVAPAVNRVVVLVNPDNAGNAWQVRAMEAAASKLRVQLTTAFVRVAPEIERAIETFATGEGSGLLVLTDFVTLAHRELIVSSAARHRLPTAFSERSFVAAGGLVSYGVDRAELFRRAASYIDRILRGAKAADLPVQQPTKFELVVNLKAAKALGLSIPETFLIRADEVIE